MSIKIMSAIFEAEFHDLEYVKDGETRKAKASTLKLVLLAIADHADDDGNAYPGYSRLEIKTALSRQGLADTLDALKYNGLLAVDEKPSKTKTNIYTINVRSLPALAREIPDLVKPLDSLENKHESSHLTSTSQATLLALVKPLDLNHHLTITEPSLSERSKKQANQKVDAILDNEKKAKGKGWTMLPEQFHPVARAFSEATSLPYTKKQAMDWLATFSDWMDAGYTPEMITTAVRDICAMPNPPAISRPGSIDWKLRDMKVKDLNRKKTPPVNVEYFADDTPAIPYPGSPS